MTGAAESGWLRAARALALNPADPAALAWLAASPALPEAPPPPAPEALVAKPAPASPATWHGSRLLALAASEDASLLERAWHARWLWLALAPDDPAALPRVSVVIPVYNRAGPVVEAVESVLAQDYPAIEIVVVDDGSADDPGAALARFGERVRFRRLAANRGVSAARNVALSMATGELVQVLDSDDTLPPTALSRKVAALAHIPDALLCFSDCWFLPLGSSEPRPGRSREIGTPTCPTQWPVIGMIHQFPFLISTLLVARHLIAAAGGFDERLRQHEDRLLFQRFGLLGAKAVAIDARLLVARHSADSLGRAPDSVGHAGLAALIFLNDLLPRPERWDCVAFVLHQCFWQRQWSLLNQAPAQYLREETARLLAWLDAFVAGQRLPQYSPRPLAAELLAVLEERGAESDEGEFATPLRQRLEAMRRARPAGPADLALWRASHNPPANRPALLAIFPELSRAIRAGRSWVPLASLDERPFRSVPHPWRRRWKRIAQSARLFGESAARLVARVRG